MAAGDATLGFQSVTNGSTINIQPPVGEQWVIQNIYWGGAVELNRADGTNAFKFDSDAGFGGRLCMDYRIANNNFMQVKNVSGGTIYIAWDGMQVV